jgi:molybdenum cofactor cytidylyltransferase
MIAAILLAAGTSSRMGRTKQLLDWGGEPLVRHVARVALGAGIGAVVAVVGHEEAQVRAALAGLPLHCVANPRYAEGQASSLQAGLAALPPATEAALVLLCDQPLITAAILDALIAAFRAGDPPLAVIPRHNGQRGNPALLSAALFGELAALTGDTGARPVLQRHSERVRWLDLSDPAVITDMDTMEEYVGLRPASFLGGVAP